jgi:hypothetical protein
MTPFNDLIATLWTLSLAQAKAFAARWGIALPEMLPRKAYAAARREIEAIEAILRRALFVDALRRMLTLSRELKDQAAETRPAATPKSKTTKNADETKEKKDRAPAPPLFRFDEPESQPGRMFHAPRILSFDEIIAMPKREARVRPDHLSTGRLGRRLDAIMDVLEDRTETVDRLARRLLKNDAPHFRPVKTGPRAQVGAAFIMQAQRAYPRMLAATLAHIAARAHNTS